MWLYALCNYVLFCIGVYKTKISNSISFANVHDWLQTHYISCIIDTILDELTLRKFIFITNIHVLFFNCVVQLKLLNSDNTFNRKGLQSGAVW